MFDPDRDTESLRREPAVRMARAMCETPNAARELMVDLIR